MAPSRMRGWVCNLQLLLRLAGDNFLGPIPVGFMITFYSLSFDTPPNLEDQDPVFIFPLKRMAYS
jgi:hypothetical protein